MPYTILRWVSTKIYTLNGGCWGFRFMASGPRVTNQFYDNLELTQSNALASRAVLRASATSSSESAFRYGGLKAAGLMLLDYPLPVVAERDNCVRILRPDYDLFKFRGKSFDGWPENNFRAGYIWAHYSHYPVIPKPINLCEDCGWMCEQQCFNFNPQCYWRNFNI